MTTLKERVNILYNKSNVEDPRLLNIYSEIENNYNTKSNYNFEILLDTSKGGEWDCCYLNDQRYLTDKLEKYCSENDFYLIFSLITIINNNYYININIDISKNYKNERN